MHISSSTSRLTRFLAVPVLLGLALTLFGCSQPAAAPAPAPSTTDVVLASTTSTQDSGLFDVLIPAFTTANPAYKVKVIAVGSGEALKMGETKDADVLLVHSPAAEKKFLADGFAASRADVMYNDFIIVGPTGDPAGLKASADTTAAMLAIKKAGDSGTTTFVTRGDNSGTNAKELTLWKTSKVATPTPAAQKWYISTGQGMGETLKVADEKASYTLTDRATWLSMKDALPGLTIAFEKDASLRNQYGVIVIPGAKNEAGGKAFADWIVSAGGQKVIAEYGIQKFGQALFTPNAE